MKQVTIKNDCISLTVLDYGAIIQKIELQNKHNDLINVVAGFEDPNDYLSDRIFLGACVGRYAGRISNGGFRINGKEYILDSKDGVHLHGGKYGFGKKYWTINSVDHSNEPSVELSYKSRAMEEGYPGELKVKVTYKLVGRSLHITHQAVTDETTVINLTNHSYFHLDDLKNINHYRLQLNSQKTLETFNNQLPTGNIIETKNSQFDFREEKAIDSQALDTTFILDNNQDVAASVYSPESGILMKLRTNQPSVVVYRPPGFAALCFETQNFPDAPNHKHFPSALLRSGETYINASIFEFDLVI